MSFEMRKGNLGISQKAISQDCPAIFFAGQFCEIALCEIPKFPKKGGVKKGNLGISQNFMIFRQALRPVLSTIFLLNFLRN